MWTTNEDPANVHISKYCKNASQNLPEGKAEYNKICFPSNKPRKIY